MLAFPPTQIGYPQHRRVFPVSANFKRGVTSDKLPNSGFLVLRKRKLKHQPSGAFLKATNGKISAFAAGPAQKGAKCPDLHISSLGDHFLHCAIQTNYQRLAKPRKEPQTRSLHFKAKPRKERNDQIFTFELGGQFLHCAI